MDSWSTASSVDIENDDFKVEELDPLDLYPSWTRQSKLLELLCRLCLKNEGSSLYDMFPTSAAAESFSTVLTSVFQIEVCYENGFPSQVCGECVSQLERSHIFKQQCIDSENILNNERSKYVMDVPQLPDIKSEVDFIFPCDMLPSEITCWSEENAIGEDILEPSTMKSEVPDIPLLNDEYDEIECKYDPLESVNSDWQEHGHAGQGVDIIHDVPAKTSTEENDHQLVFKADQDIPDFHYESNTTLYSCHHCENKYKNKSKLRCHMRKHSRTTNKYKYRCKTCSQFFNSKSKLLTHSHSHAQKISSKNKNVRPTLPSKTSSPGQLQIHKAIKTVGQFPCDLCVKVCTTKHTLNEHQRLHRNDRPYQCKTCPMSFKWGYSLYCHRKSCTEKSSQDAKISAPIPARKTKRYLSEQQSTIPNKLMYNCFHCKKSFNLRPAYRSHQKNCKTIMARQKKIDEGLSTQSKKWKCNICSSLFSKRSTLVHHELIHANKKSLHCKICSKTVASRSEVKLHLRMHAEERTIQCANCGVRFKQARYLTNHIKRWCKKTKELPHTQQGTQKTNSKCSPSKTYNLDSFHNNKSLTQHLKVNTENPKFQCAVCPLSFKARYFLSKHQQVHRKDRQFQCNKCPLSFKRRDNLIVHQRTHTGEKPYECKICNTSFMWKEAYFAHVKSCTKTSSSTKDITVPDEKKISKSSRTYRKSAPIANSIAQKSMVRPHKCVTCKKCFTKYHHLIDHQRIHTGERPFICKNCNASFMWRQSHSNHVLSCKKTLTEKTTVPVLKQKSKPSITYRKPASLKNPRLLSEHQCHTCQKVFATNRSLAIHQLIHTGIKNFGCENCNKFFRTNYHLSRHKMSKKCSSQTTFT